MGVGEQPVEGGQVAEERIDIPWIADVITVVDHRGAEERGEPQRVHAEQLQVTQPVVQALQISYAITIGVSEGTDIDLVEDGIAPPGLLFGGEAAVVCASHGIILPGESRRWSAISSASSPGCWRPSPGNPTAPRGAPRRVPLRPPRRACSATRRRARSA